MEEWNQDYLGLVEQTGFEFDDNQQGGFVIAIVKGWLDCRYSREDGSQKAAFSCEGYSECDLVCERGWVGIEVEKRISGNLFIRGSDDSEVEAYKL